MQNAALNDTGRDGRGGGNTMFLAWPIVSNCSTIRKVSFWPEFSHTRATEACGAPKFSIIGTTCSLLHKSVQTGQRLKLSICSKLSLFTILKSSHTSFE